MLKTLFSGSGRIASWFVRAASLGIALMMFITLFDVIGRAFNHPIVGSNELIETLLGMTVFLGMGWVTLDRSHITVDFLVVSLPKRTQTIFFVISGLIGTVFIGFATWQMYVQVHGRVIEHLTTTLWKIPMWPVTLVMTLGLTLMLILLLIHWLGDILRLSGRPGPDDAPPTEVHLPGSTQIE